MKKLIHLSMLVVLVLQSFIPVIDAMAKEASQAALTNEEQAGLQQDATITPAEAAPELTPTTPVEAMATPTEMPVVTVTPTETPLPPTPETTTTPIPTQADNVQLTGEQYKILLDANPEFISPGGRVNLQWQIADGKDKLKGFDLVFLLPDGAVLRTEKNRPQESEKSTEIYRIPAEEKGILHLEVGANAEMPVLIQVLLLPQETGTDRMAYLVAEPLAQGQIALVEKLEVQKAGGRVAGLNGKVKVTFSEEALSESAEVFIHRPLPESMPFHSLSGKPFEITAKQMSNRAEMKNFGAGIKIEVDYSDLAIEPGEEAHLYLYWYDPELNEWLALPSFVDPQTKTLRATTTHFTVFDVGVNDWDASRTPSIENFQVSEFTGAASYSLPIEVLPGPGGLQPSLSLSYNSQVVDQSTLLTQASWVGMGWSLDVGSISMNDNGTTDWTEDDRYFLRVAGVSTRLLRGPDGQFHMEDENFWKISFDQYNNIWKVWDTTGNRYTFSAVTRMGFPRNCYNADHGGGIDYMSYQWQLTEMENIHGQKISYAYEKDTKDLPGETYINANGRCEPRTYTIDTAIYLKSISYPGLNNPYKIEFEREERFDYPAGWDTDAAPHQYQKKRLSKINIYNGATIVRQYELLYAESPVAQANGGWIFPGFAHRADGSGKMSTLRAVREYGLNGAGLPLTVFTYDGLHLVKGENGYGGMVKFSYTPYVEYAGTDENSVAEYDFGTTWNCPAITAATTSYWHIASGSASLNCNASDPTVAIAGKIHIWNIKSKNGTTPIRPGGTYRLTAKATNLESGATWTIGATDFTQTFVSATSASIGEIQHTFTMNSSGQWLSPNIQTNNKYVTITNFKLEALPTFYRVQTRELYAGADAAPYTFTYTYSDPHTNDPLRSEVVESCPPDSTTCKQYVEQYSEFRGHGVVEVADPYGKVFKTYYEQSDKLKGKPTRVEVWAGTKLISSSHNTYAIQPLDPDVLVSPEGIPYIGVGRAFIYTQSDEQRTYNNAGTQVASIVREYDYGSNIIADYGNLKEMREKKDGELYRRTEYYSYPLNSVDRYLVSLPAKQKLFDPAGNLLGLTIYLYDGNQGDHQVTPANGKLTSVRTLVKGLEYAQVDYGYDAWGNQTSVTNYSQYAAWDTNPAGGARTTSSEYDTIYHTYPLKSIDPLGNTVRWNYDYNLGLPVSETDPNNAITTAEYDSFGRMIRLIRPLDDFAHPTIKIAYYNQPSDICNDAPFCAEISQRISGDQYYTLRRYYDGIGREFKTQTGSTSAGIFALYNTVDTNFVSATETHQTIPYGSEQATPIPSAETKTEYVDGIRTTTQTAPDGSITVTTVNGLTTTVTEVNMLVPGVGTEAPSGRKTTSLTDAWGRTILVTPPEGPGVTYEYDLLGNLVKATRGESVTRIKYDMAGRKIGMDDPDMGIAGNLNDDLWGWNYNYDALGNLTSQIDARSCTISMAYDLLNRLKSKTSSGAGCVTPVNTIYTYDIGPNSRGRRTGMTDASGSSTWIYDVRGRMTSETKAIDGQSFTSQWTYNSADLPLTMTYPDGEVVTNTYTPEMMLEKVTGTSTYVFDTTYDPAGRMDMRQLGGEVLAVPPPAPVFSDVSAGYWAQREIEGLYNLGIVGNCGVNPLRYCPGSQVTRASVAIDILRAKYGGSYNPPTPTSQRFTDVPTTHSAYKWIDKFAADGITGGCTATTYCPDSPVTRIQIVIFLLRAKYGSGYTPPAVPANGHVFADMIGHWGEAWAVDAKNKGITSGCGSGNFCPNTNVTREAEAVLIDKTFNSASAAATPTPAPVTDISPVIEQKYDYFDWTQQGGRLSRLTVKKLATTSTTLQDLSYQYDAAGNIRQISDPLNSETQVFSYDALDRLKSWTLTGNVPAQESYDYDPVTGNLTTKGSATLAYSDPNHDHAVSSTSTGNSYGYDANGNQTVRTIGGQIFNLRYDAENRLVEVKKGVAVIAAFTYDGDGRQVKSVVDGVTTLYAGAHYEKRGSEITKYYFAGASRIAMRRYTIPVSSILEFILGNHLGSTSLTVDKNGDKTSAMRYKPWGEVRYSWTKDMLPGLPTEYTFTGQRSHMDDPTTTGATEGFGLMFYNARWYDPSIGRFAQADSMLDNPITGWDRYAYVQNNPIRYNDPTGHLTNKLCPDGICEDLGKQNKRDRPDSINEDLLSDKEKLLLDLYRKMWEQKDGWWWQEYGKGGFTIWEFMAVMWSYEQASYSPGRNVSAAMANHAAAWCADQGCNHNSAEGALSFLVAYSASARKRIKAIFEDKKNMNDVFYKPPSYYSNGMHVVQAIHNRAGVDFVPLRTGDLYDFGNVSLSSKILGLMIKRDMVYSFWGDGNTFIVMTKCQSDFYYAARTHRGTRFVTGSNYRQYCGG